MTISYDVVVECPRCHKVLCPLVWLPGHDHVSVLGNVGAQNGDPGGALRVSIPDGRRRRAQRVVSSDPALPPGASSAEGRKTLSCNGRHHGRRLSWTVTQAALDATYRRAIDAGRFRVSAAELHA